MTFEQIQAQIVDYNRQGLKMFASSSFQSHSIVMLDIISKTDKSIPVFFVDTGFHFPETLEYKEKIADLLKLNVVNLRSITPKNLQRDPEGNLLFTSDPDFCCFLNKTQPVEQMLDQFEVWINGVRSDQNSNRSKLNIFETTKQGTVRFHPMLDWTSSMIESYIIENKIPRHPLELKGYQSIGCEPCTRKSIGNNERDARWFGMNKTECGLNLDLIKK
ncbi:MAG: phosphoadenylyl-sulfate reductase [Bacteroidota bacterium]